MCAMMEKLRRCAFSAGIGRAGDNMPIEGAQRMSSQEGARVRVPPPLVFAVAIVAGWFIPLGIGLDWPLRLALGGLLLLLGVALGGWAFRLFRKTGQDPAPWKPSPELILQGPYR